MLLYGGKIEYSPTCSLAFSTSADRAARSSLSAGHSAQLADKDETDALEGDLAAASLRACCGRVVGDGCSGYGRAKCPSVLTSSHRPHLGVVCGLLWGNLKCTVLSADTESTDDVPFLNFAGVNENMSVASNLKGSLVSTEVRVLAPDALSPRAMDPEEFPR